MIVYQVYFMDDTVHVETSINYNYAVSTLFFLHDGVLGFPITSVHDSAPSLLSSLSSR